MLTNSDVILVMYMQLNIYATDDGFPEQNSTSDARISIRVMRNRNDPRFSGQSFSVKVEEKVDIGSPVIDIDASDGDPQVFIEFKVFFQGCRTHLCNAVV